jgi:catechol 2,3-dioxygenase-like lactoylglutathione lyase family enzyme
MDRMIDHFGINCADLDASKTFYDTVLATLGHTRVKDFAEPNGTGAIGYGSNGKPDFWITKFTDLGPNREMHLAFTAPDAESVHAFFDAAVGLGAEVLHEPRHFPEYHDHYYGGFVRDPDGNNVEAVCHRVAPDA